MMLVCPEILDIFNGTLGINSRLSSLIATSMVVLLFDFTSRVIVSYVPTQNEFEELGKS